MCINLLINQCVVELFITIVCMFQFVILILVEGTVGCYARNFLQ